MIKLPDVKAGDRVVLVYRTGRITGGKSADKVARGVVWKANPVNLVIGEESGGKDRSWTVRRDTGKETRNETMYGWKAYSAEEYAHLQRRNQAMDLIAEQGLTIRPNSMWRGREEELAAVLHKHLNPEVGIDPELFIIREGM